ncbi:hypothetical protein SLEP1_g56552 [Rubroshorea leprosula]|uniref:CG-1 domain-containing protein n=1 Tax=Rubroshorea leprosula TaxID=152421 RepID=A0AAV5MIN0_9ROSI|nr:hypothetical protein SLEP1_g56552 [Rubroshorea leprosula]
MDEGVEAGPSVPDNPLDIEQIYSKAQNQWLSRPEICRILQNHKGFPITSAPHNKPPSGSLFLFDKKVQKHYRNDGYNWKKKKDGKTLSEGHQTLKVKGYGNLDCYYARGEENRNFLRRCYWMPKSLGTIAPKGHGVPDLDCELPLPQGVPQLIFKQRDHSRKNISWTVLTW